MIFEEALFWSNREVFGRSRPILGGQFTANGHVQFAGLGTLFNGSSVLVVGGAGSIGRAVASMLAQSAVARLIIVDSNENSLVEVVRSLRSDKCSNFDCLETYCLDVVSDSFIGFLESLGKIDYVFNLAALKHVRTERNLYMLYRMLEVNVLFPLRLAEWGARCSGCVIFNVSTDKASDPINYMGASKRLMEVLVANSSGVADCRFARFANVAFSNGSLLDGFLHRMRQSQVISVPKNIQRFFMSPIEAAALCLFSADEGLPGEISVPLCEHELRPVTLTSIAKFLFQLRGYELIEFSSEFVAIEAIDSLLTEKKWAGYFYNSIDSSEKALETFFSDQDRVRFSSSPDVGFLDGIIAGDIDSQKWMHGFIQSLRTPSMTYIRDMFSELVPEFKQPDRLSSLDQSI